MPGVANRDALIAGLAGGVSVPYIKRAASTAGGSLSNTLSFQDGFAYPGGAPALGGNAAGVPVTVTYNNTASGAVPLLTAAAGKTWYIASFSAVLAGTNGAVTLYDRLAARGQLSANGSPTTVTMTLPSRVTDYSTVCAFLSSSAAATGTTYTMTYTNQDGVAGQTSTGSIHAYNACPIPGNALQHLSLAAGDTGIQSVQTFTVGAASGTYGLILARPLVPAIASFRGGETRQGWMSLVEAGADPCLFVGFNTSETSGILREVDAMIRAFQA